MAAHAAQSLRDLGLIIVKVVSANQFRRNVIKNRDDQKYSRKLTAADKPK